MPISDTGIELLQMYDVNPFAAEHDLLELFIEDGYLMRGVNVKGVYVTPEGQNEWDAWCTARGKEIP